MVDEEEEFVMKLNGDKSIHNELPGPYENERDAITGQRLDPELVAAGHQLEITFLREWHVYDYADLEECLQRTGAKPISTKWVQTNKGGDIAPNIRCRWVAREFRTGDTIFAAIAPYEAIRMLLSLAASQEERRRVGHRDFKYRVDYSAYYMHGAGERQQDHNDNNYDNDDDNNNDYIGNDFTSDENSDRIRISLVDIKRAYFNAPVNEDEPVYVQLLPEDPWYGNKCGEAATAPIRNSWCHSWMGG